MPNTSLVPKNLSETEEPCLICKKKGDIFTCNGGCGLHVHPLCIGEFAIFPFVVGQLCGSCFIVQQNRASPEDLTKGGPNALSVRRAILCINLETNSNTNFDKFGHLASLRLGEIGSIAGYPIKPFAEKFVEPYLQRWIREKLVTADKWMLNVREVFTVMIGLYSLKRACIAHSLHDKVIELMKARKFTVVDYFGWHPAIESPTVRCSSLCAVCGIRNLPEVDLCSRCHHKLVFPTTFTKYISTLLAAFYAEQVGIPLGASTLDVFAHTNTVRGLYKGLQPFDADGVVWELFTDQLRMIFGFLDIMSNFGTLQLNPDLFVPEVNIIYNPAYVNQAMINNEFEVVGKFLQCMKLFGLAKSMEHKNMIESCERYLLFKHLPNGSWCKTNGSIVDQYKATVTCSKALLTPQVRGYGPISQEFQRLLVKWARTSSPKLAAATTAGDKQLAGTGKHKLLASGAMVDQEALSINDDTPMAADGTTDSEDFKSDHPTSEDDPIASSKSQDDDEMLTNMSLHEDLEIFDGLQFEDGGGVIDLSYQSLATHGEVADDSGRHAIDEADGTDATGQDDDEDDTIEDHMYDDDEDEIEQEETTPHQSRTIEEDGGTVSTDFPPEM
ncbi:hypothetical protein PsorP6_005300 [Peronosclerospora sorghi]|uniref:Uncharacterized protein n=1 Tax=Peronosclerospora sorghi TaxID=230839 RepID=A0ACC0W7Y8_9STRA|nr:hypothetical protein PsorP6_005300 [Peronosclerospora sorghi]